jgi:hypothetical protein
MTMVEAALPDGSTLQTTYEFELPKGYVGNDGIVHRHGVMRLATARDEILPLRDPRVRDNEAYLTVLLLSRVITSLGDLDQVNAAIVEGLFAPDLAFLQDLYRRINQEGHTHASVQCPSCETEFAVDVTGGLSGGC